MVVQQDQSVHRATVLVSVDNQPPEVQITYPGNQTEITVSAEKIIILQADVQDDLVYRPSPSTSTAPC